MRKLGSRGDRTTKWIRRIARTLSVVIIAFTVVMIVGHLFRERVPGGPESAHRAFEHTGTEGGKRHVDDRSLPDQADERRHHPKHKQNYV